MSSPRGCTFVRLRSWAPSSGSCRNARRGGGIVGRRQRKGGASGTSSYWKRPRSRYAVDPELLEQILPPEPVFAEVRRFGVDRHDRHRIGEGGDPSFQLPLKTGQKLHRDALLERPAPKPNPPEKAFSMGETSLYGKPTV